MALLQWSLREDGKRWQTGAKKKDIVGQVTLGCLVLLVIGSLILAGCWLAAGDEGASLTSDRLILSQEGSNSSLPEQVSLTNERRHNSSTEVEEEDTATDELTTGSANWLLFEQQLDNQANQPANQKSFINVSDSAQPNERATAKQQLPARQAASSGWRSDGRQLFRRSTSVGETYETPRRRRSSDSKYPLIVVVVAI